MSNPARVSEIFSSIQGEGYLAGRRQIFIRLDECNLDCRYCDTVYESGASCQVETAPGSGVLHALPQPPGADALVRLVGEWCHRLPGAHHSISVTGGEPLLQAETLGEWLPELRRILPIHLETNGTLHAELGRVIDSIDYISMDMKLPSTAGCGRELWEAHRRFLEVAVQRQVSVKVVIGQDTPLDEIGRVCAIMTAVEPTTPLFLQPLSNPAGGVDVTAAQILRLQETAAALLPDVRVIPQMHKMLGAL
ncbi:7-carboxy-7-deazaguanine synthase QueE [Geobacter sp. FeAm09]|uniref:7-carboxy-7-deazaguanine synthase QueE n=1 Tax=Geobacter sp. FeAm09 TaxID=2597769 RepID=UPI0011EFBA8A|nr:7-carboxy-7-deazaguanine synthase QueE [Geobacter sp. FeAm09]QEM68480.1 7-carboxy-7-deazaguanine synthase QueE [Geobacter sp. FeAm09]